MKMNAMKMRLIITVVLLFGLSMHIFASEPLIVEKLVHKPTDLSASTAPSDMNGRSCGLLKVITDDKSMTFEGSVIGSPEYKNGEYWVYLPAGTYLIRIKVSQKEPLMVNFRDYNLNQVMPKATYELYFKQQKDVSYIYLDNAYSALRNGDIDNARTYYQHFKDTSGKSDSLFESVLSKSDGSYIWSETELKTKGFKLECEGLIGEIMYQDEDGKYNLSFTKISGLNGESAFIEKEYGHMKFIHGDVIDGYLNGVCLLSSNGEYSVEDDEFCKTVYNNIYELAYITHGKVVTPTIGVFRSPVIINNNDPLKEYRDLIFINEYGVRYFSLTLDQANDYPIIEFLKQMFAPDILSHSFLDNFRVGSVDIEYIRNNFNSFMMSNTKIPTHVWDFH